MHGADGLSLMLSALADPTRRKVLASLSRSEQPVSELAAGHEMSLPGFMKHLQVLEDCGLDGDPGLPAAASLSEQHAG